MHSFTQLNAYKQLRKLAENPINLSKSVTKERIADYKIELSLNDRADYLKLLYATERVNEEVIKKLCALAEETKAVALMLSMQAGAAVNTGEKRAALHTAMRNFPQEDSLSLATKQMTEKAYLQIERLKEFMKKIEDEGITDVIQVGIGGSDLGPRSVYYALEKYKIPGRRVHFISNVDPDDAALVLENLNPSTTLVVIVSKSGTTLETKTNEMLVRKWYRDRGISTTIANHFVLVTTEGGAADSEKSKESYRALFYIWDVIGGRYSTTSMIGGFLLSFAFGMAAFLEFLAGAHFMDLNAREENPRKNMALFSALLGIWNRNFLNHSSLAIIPYSQPMHRFTAHLQQLDMESNGKSVDKTGQLVDFETGPIIWGEPGTNCQHSFFQSIHQGTTVVPIEFIAFERPQHKKDLEVEGSLSQDKLVSNLFAQSLALALGKAEPDNLNKEFSGNRPNRIVLAGELTPYSMGALLAYYENKVAFQGFIWNINSFDQEGVQYGKLLAETILGIHKGKPYPLGQAYLDHLTASKKR